MKRESHKVTLFKGLPRQGWFWLLVTVLFSALLHLMSLINLDKLPGYAGLARPKTRSEPSKVTVKIIEKPKLKEKYDPSEPDKAQKIVEAPMTPTDPAKDAKYMGAQDHQTDRETRVSNLAPRPKGADAGAAGEAKINQLAIEKNLVTAAQPNTAKPKKQELATPNKKTEILLSPQGTVQAAQPQRKPRNAYESLMPQAEEMHQQVAAGYQDFVDEGVEVGERVDLNTSNFRYLAYFSSIRKAFELVWTYPSEAVRRGLQGEVKVEFTIQRNGTVSRIKVLDGSGHKILDDAVVEAITLAAPFTPLPVGMKKDRLTVVGSFRYVLTNYAGAM